VSFSLKVLTILSEVDLPNLFGQRREPSVASILLLSEVRVRPQKGNNLEWLVPWYVFLGETSKTFLSCDLY